MRVWLNSQLDPQGGAFRQQIHDVIGNAEMAVWAIHKAVQIACRLPEKYPSVITRPPPLLVRQKLPALEELRHAYAHIDDRAVGETLQGPHQEALTAFGYSTLIEERKLTYGGSALDVDEEARNVLITTRDYLWEVWKELVNDAGLQAAPN